LNIPAIMSLTRDGSKNEMVNTSLSILHWDLKWMKYLLK